MGGRRLARQPLWAQAGSGSLDAVACRGPAAPLPATRVSSCPPAHVPQLPTSPLPCSLYVAVITTIRGWGDLLWVDVVEKIDAMSTQVGFLVAATGLVVCRAGIGVHLQCW